MKELIIGDVAVYSEDGDSWDELIKVVKKASKAYLESIPDIKPTKETWIEKIKRKLKEKNIFF